MARRDRVLLVVGIVVTAALFLGSQVLLRSAVSVVAAGISTSAETSSRGYFYLNRELGFSAEFPGKPSESTTSQEVEGVALTTTTVTWLDGESPSVISITPVPGEWTWQDVESLLTASIQDAVRATGGSVSSEITTDLDGAPARAARITMPSGDVVRVLVAFENNLRVTMAAPLGEPFDALEASFTFTE